MFRDAAGYFACASLRQVAPAAGGDGAIRIASVARVQRGGGGAREPPSLLVAAEPHHAPGGAFSVAAPAVEDAATEACTPSESAPSESQGGCIWWVASEAAAPSDPPLGSFRTRHPYVVDFYHLRSSIDGLDNVSTRLVDCVFTLEKATAHGDLILCAYPRWRSIASTIPTIQQYPSQNDGTVQLLPLSCESASLTVSTGPIPMIIIGKVASVCVYTHFHGSFSLVTEIHANSRGDRTFNQHMPIPRYLTLVAASSSLIAFSQGSVLKIMDVSACVTAWSSAQEQNESPSGQGPHQNTLRCDFSDSLSHSSEPPGNSIVRKMLFYECNGLYKGLLVLTSRHCYFFNCTQKEHPQLLNLLSFARDIFEVDVAPHRPALYVLTAFGLEVWSLPMPERARARYSCIRGGTVPTLLALQGLQGVPKSLRCLPRQLVVLENDALIIVPDAHPELAEEQNDHLRGDTFSRKNFKAMHKSRQASKFAMKRGWVNNKCGVNALLSAGSNPCDVELSRAQFELRATLQEQVLLRKSINSDQNESKANNNEAALVPEPAWLGLIISAHCTESYLGEGINVNVRPSRTMIVFHANGIDKLVGSMEPFCSELELDARVDGRKDHRSGKPQNSISFGKSSRHFLLKTFLRSTLSYYIRAEHTRPVIHDSGNDTQLSLLKLFEKLVLCQERKAISTAAEMLSRLLILQGVVMCRENISNDNSHEQILCIASEAACLLTLAEHLSLEQIAQLLKPLLSARFEVSQSEEAKISDHVYARAACEFLCSFVENASAPRMASLRSFLSSNSNGINMLKAALELCAAQSDIGAIGKLLLTHPLRHQYTHGRKHNDLFLPCIGATVASKALSGGSDRFHEGLEVFLESLRRRSPEFKDEVGLLLQCARCECLKGEGEDVQNSAETLSMTFATATVIRMYNMCGISILFGCCSEGKTETETVWQPTALCRRIVRDSPGGRAAILQCVIKSCARNDDGILRGSAKCSELAMFAVKFLTYEDIWTCVAPCAEKNLMRNLVDWLFNACFSKEMSPQTMFEALQELVELVVSGWINGRQEENDVSAWTTLLVAMYLVRMCGREMPGSDKPMPMQSDEFDVSEPPRSMRFSSHWLEPWLQSAKCSTARKLMNIIIPECERPSTVPDLRVLLVLAETVADVAEEKWPSLLSSPEKITHLDVLKVLCLCVLGDLGEATQALLHIAMRTALSGSTTDSHILQGESKIGEACESMSIERLFAAFCREYCTSVRSAQDIIEKICSVSMASDKPSVPNNLALRLCEQCMSSATFVAKSGAQYGDVHAFTEENCSLSIFPDHANILYFGRAVRAMHRRRLAKHAIEELVGAE